MRKSLAAFYLARFEARLGREDRVEKLAPQAFFWFYKAGFAAARLLESSKRWDQAIKVYEMIAAAGGPRSEEATSHINKIRLENFLWDGPSGGDMAHPLQEFLPPLCG